jgi:putative nucleotidyltransferase with HDIG domain
MSDKKQILFVDDEPRVLQGIRRMLHGMRNEWELNFAPGGAEALQWMAKQPVDVIVSDMRMPNMDGAELLNEVLKTYPETIRIVLSGHADRDMILKTVRPAHQYLSKPCDADTLKGTIQRACSLRELLLNDEMKKLVSSMDTLPSLPDLYVKITNEIQSTDPSIKRVGEIIEKDIGMSAKILQLVNSAFFGLPRHISSPSQAVTMLGLDMVKALVLSIHVFSSFDSSRLEPLSLSRLWNHSATVGQWARRIAEIENMKAEMVDHALISGLLHDIGKLVMAANLPDQYQQVIKIASDEDKSISEAETEVFNTNHASIGAYMMGLWGLPTHTVESIAFHNTPCESATSEVTVLTAVHAADAIFHRIHPASTASSEPMLNMDYIDKLQMLDRIPVWESACQELLQQGEQ